MLQPGESVRIRTRGLILELRPGASCEIRIVRRSPGTRFARAVLAWWQRMHRRGTAAARSYLRTRRLDRDARLLAQLDARFLKDIGLEVHHGGALIERIDAHRRRELLRTLAASLGP